MKAPIDANTGLQSGEWTHTGTVEVLAGYLATHADGTEALLRLDKARADLYAARHHATIEPMFVRRQAGALA